MKSHTRRVASLFTEGAGQGVPFGKVKPGFSLHLGIGVEQSVERALVLFREVAGVGDPPGECGFVASRIGLGSELPASFCRSLV